MTDINPEHVEAFEKIHLERDGKSMTTRADYIGGCDGKISDKDALIQIQYNYFDKVAKYSIYVNGELTDGANALDQLTVRLRNAQGWSIWK